MFRVIFSKLLKAVIEPMSTARKYTRATVFCLLSAIVAPLYGQPVELDRVLAIADEGVVLKSEFEQRWQQIEQQLAQSQGPAPPRDQLRRQLLDQLILENLQLQLAQRNGIRVDDNQLNQVMANIAAQNNMDFEQFRQTLQAQGLYQATRENLRREVTIANFEQAAVNRRINITRQEVENYLRSEAGLSQTAPEYRVAHILIPNSEDSSAAQREELAGLLYQEIEKGEDIMTFVNAGRVSGIRINGGDLGWNKPENLPSLFRDVVPNLTGGETAEPFQSPNGWHIVKLLQTRGGSTMNVEQFHVRHILIRPDEIRTLEQAEQLAWDLYERIQDGEDFGDIARQNTMDHSSIVQGGDLDWVDQSQVPPEFWAEVREAEMNVVQEPFLAPTGWHIIEVMDRRMEDMSQENARFQARNILRERKYENERQNWLTEMRDTSHIVILDPALRPPE